MSIYSHDISLYPHMATTHREGEFLPREDWPVIVVEVEHSENVAYEIIHRCFVVYIRALQVLEGEAFFFADNGRRKRPLNVFQKWLEKPCLQEVVAHRKILQRLHLG